MGLDAADDALSLRLARMALIAKVLTKFSRPSPTTPLRYLKEEVVLEGIGLKLKATLQSYALGKSPNENWAPI